MTVCILFYVIGYCAEMYIGVDFIKSIFAYHSDSGFIRFMTMFTSGFVHLDVGHLFGNMMVLMVIHQILRHIDNYTVWKLFLLGNMIALVMVIFYMLICKIDFPQLLTLVSSEYTFLGASCGIFTMLGFLTFNYPYKTVKLWIFNTKVIYLSYYLLALSLFNMVGHENLFGNVSHVGGFLFAYYLHKTGRDKHVFKL
jgi:membrane associated rhomboid family serine protease